MVRNQKRGKANEPEKEKPTEQAKRSGNRKARAVGWALEVAGTIINLLATIIDKMTQ